MKHTYNITGMTCNPCVANVEKALQSIENITDEKANQETNEFVTTMTKHVSIERLRKVLSKKYIISSQEEIIHCKGLDTSLRQPTSVATFMESSIMIIMVIFMLLQ